MDELTNERRRRDVIEDRVRMAGDSPVIEDVREAEDNVIPSPLVMKLRSGLF